VEHKPYLKSGKVCWLIHLSFFRVAENLFLKNPAQRFFEFFCFFLDFCKKAQLDEFLVN